MRTRGGDPVLEQLLRRGIEHVVYLRAPTSTHERQAHLRGLTLVLLEVRGRVSDQHADPDQPDSYAAFIRTLMDQTGVATPDAQRLHDLLAFHARRSGSDPAIIPAPRRSSDPL